jgi:type VI protein secretion system component VasA
VIALCAIRKLPSPFPNKITTTCEDSAPFEPFCFLFHLEAQSYSNIKDTTDARGWSLRAFPW